MTRLGAALRLTAAWRRNGIMADLGAWQTWRMAWAESGFILEEPQ